MSENVEAIAKIRERIKELNIKVWGVESRFETWMKGEDSVELRYLYLALAFLKGRSYASVEPKCDPWKWLHEVACPGCYGNDRSCHEAFRGQLELREVLILAANFPNETAYERWQPWAEAAQAHIDSQKEAHSAQQIARAEGRKLCPHGTPNKLRCGGMSND